MSTTVVHCKKQSFTKYIGRKSKGMHFGNPFSHLSYGLGLVKVRSREEAIQRCRTWVLGQTDLGVEPERREWILAHLHELKDGVLGCYCKPLDCHGDIYVELVDSSS